MAFKQEQGPAHMIQETLASRSRSRKIATFKNAVMTFGPHGVAMTHVPIVERDHTSNNARDEGLFKFLRVHKKANRFNTITTRKIVVIQATGEKVR